MILWIIISSNFGYCGYGYCLMIMLQLFVITEICLSAKGQVRLCRMLTRGLLRIKGSEKGQIYTRKYEGTKVASKLHKDIGQKTSVHMWNIISVSWDDLQLKKLRYIWAPIGNDFASQSSSISISFFLHLWHLSHHTTLTLWLSTKISLLRRNIVWDEICQRNFVFHVLLCKLFVPKLVSEELLVL